MALGLAISTVAVSSAKDKATEIGATAQATSPPGAPAPTADELQQFQDAISPVAFTHGSTIAFIVGAGMILTAALITLLFLNVKHQELATDGAPEGVHVG